LHTNPIPACNIPTIILYNTRVVCTNNIIKTAIYA